MRAGACGHTSALCKHHQCTYLQRRSWSERSARSCPQAQRRLAFKGRSPCRLRVAAESSDEGREENALVCRTKYSSFVCSQIHDKAQLLEFPDYLQRVQCTLSIYLEPCTNLCLNVCCDSQAPVKTRTAVGKMLDYYLRMEPHLFDTAMEKQLTELQEEKEKKEQQAKEAPLSTDQSELVLYRSVQAACAP